MNQKQVKRVSQQHVWNRIAEEWAKYKTKISPAVEDFLKGKKGRILDLGCGSGRNFVKLNDSVFYCIDFSKEMLKYAEQRAEKLGVNVKLIKSDSSIIPFPENYFDTAICIALLHCIKGDKRQKTLNEIYRVLKLGRQAFISVWSRNSPRLKNKPKECFVSWTTKNEKEKRYTYIYDKDELEREIESAGFRIIRSWEERNINVIAVK